MRLPGEHAHKFVERNRTLTSVRIIEDECQGDHYDPSRNGCGRLRRRFDGKYEERSWGRK